MTPDPEARTELLRIEGQGPVRQIDEPVGDTIGASILHRLGDRLKAAARPGVA
ncbi:MAG: hypothetical protein LC637_02840 [Xanthomonadaceae bacterium]|nr:hypothetical protein [Xanthomonadaceae bacterium]